MPILTSISTLPERLLFIDIETTGLYNSDRLVSFAAVELETASIGSDTYRLRLAHFIFDPGRKSHPKAEEVHGYSDWVLRHQEPFADCADRVWPLFDEAVLIVAHNADFDMPFLAREFERAGRPLPERPVFCTMQAFSERVGGRSGLDAVLRQIGIQRRHGPHNALEDAWLSMQVFLWLNGLPLLPQQALPAAPPSNMRPVPPMPVGKLPRRRRPRPTPEQAQPAAAEEGLAATVAAQASDADLPPSPSPPEVQAAREVDERLVEACRSTATLMLWIARADGASEPEIGALAALVRSRMERVGSTGDDTCGNAVAALAEIETTEEAVDAAVRELVRDAQALSDLSRWLRMVTYADGKGSEQERGALDRITASFEKARQESRNG